MTDKELEDFRLKLPSLRYIYGLTSEEIAKRLGVSRITYINVEKRNLNLLYYNALKNVFVELSTTEKFNDILEKLNKTKINEIETAIKKSPKKLGITFASEKVNELLET